jgi:hypothetical protein
MRVGSSLTIRRVFCVGSVLLSVAVPSLRGQEAPLPPLFPKVHQLPTDRVTRDDSAVALLQASIAALGGAQAISAISDSSATGTFKGTVSSGSFSWVDSGWEFRYRYKSANGTDWANSLFSAHGKGQMSAGDKTVSLAHYARNTHLPFPILGHRLVQILQHPIASIGPVTPATIQGQSVSSVEIHIGTDLGAATSTRQIWYFDSATSRPVAIDFFEPDIMRIGRGATMRVVLGNYQQTSGISVPYSVDLSISSGATILHYQVDDVKFNQSPASTLFDQK